MASSSIDALPYFDKQLETPGAKAAAQALIEAELKRTPKVQLDDPRLPPDVEVFPRSTHLAELLRNYEKEPIRGIDPSKYGVPTAPEGASIEELEEIERRGRIAEAHMALRNENVAILSAHAPNAWLVRNYQLNAELKELQSTLTGMEEQVTEVNRARRVYQEDVGQHLTRLEKRWGELVGSTVQLELACMAMQGEVEGLREKREALRGEVKALEGGAE